MNQFKIGDTVRCINDNPNLYDEILPKEFLYSRDMSGLRKGNVYIVREVELCHVGNFSAQRELDLMGVKLEGIERFPIDLPFGCTRFELFTEENSNG